MSYKIEIKQGNLIKENATFIVNASNTLLSLGSGVSHAFKIHCKDGLQELLYKLKVEYETKFGKIEKGDLIVSPSLAENFKYGFHIAIMDYSGGEPNPTLETIKKAIENIHKTISEILKRDNLKESTLVIPLMGTGVGGLTKKEVAKIYKDEFLNANIDFDCKIIIYAHSLSDYEILKEVFL